MNISKKRAYESGRVDWRLSDGALHREDGPAVIYADGTELWYKNDKLHRTDGPAIIRPVVNNTTGIIRYWYKNNELHRIDGPAIIYPDGTTRYWVDGIEYDPVTFLVKSYEYLKEA